MLRRMLEPRWPALLRAIAEAVARLQARWGAQPGTLGWTPADLVHRLELPFVLRTEVLRERDRPGHRPKPEREGASAHREQRTHPVAGVTLHTRFIDASVVASRTQTAGADPRTTRPPRSTRDARPLIHPWPAGDLLSAPRIGHAPAPPRPSRPQRPAPDDARRFRSTALRPSVHADAGGAASSRPNAGNGVPGVASAFALSSLRSLVHPSPAASTMSSRAANDGLRDLSSAPAFPSLRTLATPGGPASANPSPRSVRLDRIIGASTLSTSLLAHPDAAGAIVSASSSARDRLPGVATASRSLRPLTHASAPGAPRPSDSPPSPIRAAPVSSRWAPLPLASQPMSSSLPTSDTARPRPRAEPLGRPGPLAHPAPPELPAAAPSARSGSVVPAPADTRLQADGTVEPPGPSPGIDPAALTVGEVRRLADALALQLDKRGRLRDARRALR